MRYRDQATALDMRRSDLCTARLVKTNTADSATRPDDERARLFDKQGCTGGLLADTVVDVSQRCLLHILMIGEVPKMLARRVLQMLVCYKCAVCGTVTLGISALVL